MTRPAPPRISAILLLLACAVALLPPPATAAASPAPLSFHVPAQAGGEVSAASAQWALVVFHPGVAQATLTLPGGAEGATHTVVAAAVREPFHLGDPRPSEPVQTPMRVDAGSATLGFAGGRWASLYVLAERIEATVSGGGRLGRADAGEAVTPLLGQPPPDGTLPPFPHEAGPGAATLARGGDAASGGEGASIHLSIAGLRRVEWYNATARCSMACPDGPAYQAWAAPGLPGDRVEVRNYTTLDLRGGSATVSGVASALVLGGPSLDATVDGWLRLPQADLEGCEGCGGGRTLLLEGEGLALRGLSPQGQPAGRLGGSLHAPAALATLDEGAGFPLAATAAGVAAGGGLAVAAALALLRFRSRAAAPAEPGFGHQRRTGLFDLVASEPGLTFREVERRLGWGNGVTRHHLDVLVQEGHLVARRHLNTVRYFENHGRFDADWQSVVHRRDPGTRWLLEVLEQEPLTQRGIVERAAQRGWSRSATQRRLARLVADGLVASQPDGNGRRYAVIPQAPAPAPAGHGWLGRRAPTPGGAAAAAPARLAGTAAP